MARIALITLLASAITYTGTTDEGHRSNTLFARLQSPGLEVAAGRFVPLPAPVMADHLDATRQRAVIQALPGRTQEVDELLRPSPVAPFVLKFNDLPGPEQPVRSVDVAFVAQGGLETLMKTDVLDRLLNSGRKDAQITPLTEADRARRQLAASQVQEAHAHVSLPLMDRVLLEGSVQTMWTRTGQSLVLAGQLDPRLNHDADFPNRWTLLRRNADGKPQPIGSPHPYQAAAFFAKFTPLAAPADALFVEWHLVFVEPAEWFDGANLLRSKLPLVLQTQVRAFRRDLLR